MISFPHCILVLATFLTRSTLQLLSQEPNRWRERQISFPNSQSHLHSLSMHSLTHISSFFISQFYLFLRFLIFPFFHFLSFSYFLFFATLSLCINSVLYPRVIHMTSTLWLTIWGIYTWYKIHFPIVWSIDFLFIPLHDNSMGQYAAAFWYNMKPTGEGDLLSMHAGCPVLLGQKWG